MIRAIRSLRPGDVVAENYGPIFTKRSLEDRRRTLAARYWFRCECTACREDWPRFETLTNDTVRLRCKLVSSTYKYRVYAPAFAQSEAESESERGRKNWFSMSAGVRPRVAPSYTRVPEIPADPSNVRPVDEESTCENLWTGCASASTCTPRDSPRWTRNNPRER